MIACEYGASGGTTPGSPGPAAAVPGDMRKRPTPASAVSAARPPVRKISTQPPVRRRPIERHESYRMKLAFRLTCIALPG